MELYCTLLGEEESCGTREWRHEYCGSKWLFRGAPPWGRVVKVHCKFRLRAVSRLGASQCDFADVVDEGSCKHLALRGLDRGTGCCDGTREERFR